MPHSFLSSLQLKCIMFCMLAPLGVSGSEGSLVLQYGSDFESQDQLALDTGLSLSKFGHVNFGMGRSEYTYVSSVTTDYYSVGYSSPHEKNVVVAVIYDHWQRNMLQADSWRADLYVYGGDWRVGIHPEWHTITFSGRRNSLDFQNRGVGVSLGYFATDELYVYGDYYRYQFEVPPRLLERFRFLPLRTRIALRLLANELSTEFDETSASLGADYYFNTVSIGVEQQQMTSIINSERYSITSLQTTLTLDDHWLVGVRLSNTSGSLGNFYSFTLSYDWY